MDPMTAMFLSQAGGSLLGGLLGGQKGPLLKPDAVLNILRGNFKRTDARYQQGLDQLLASYKVLQSGYDSASKDISRIGESAKSDVLGREQQQLADNTQSAVDRGLYRTTAPDTFARGIHADTNRSLAGISSGLAGLRSNLDVGRGNALASFGTNIASWYPAWAEAVNAGREKYGMFGLNGQTQDNTGSAVGGAVGAFGGAGGFDWLKSLFSSGGGGWQGGTGIF